ncbi:MAG TPA: VOC family protein [Gammaproteobacteria bacterium]|nr:VOC family protein [Gammaproteobacteria bacterium]
MTQVDNDAARQAAGKGVHSLSPHLICAGAADAIEFYREAFGATELIRLPGKDGKLMHACIRINDSSVMLVDEFPQQGSRSPKSLQGTPVSIHLIVDDVDAWMERAAGAGAAVVMPAADMFWGDRFGILEDPFGHRWSISTPQRQLTTDELHAAAADAVSEMQCPGA